MIWTPCRQPEKDLWNLLKVRSETESLCGKPPKGKKIFRIFTNFETRKRFFFKFVLEKL